MAPLTRLCMLALCACASAQFAEERAPRYVASGAQNNEPVTPVAILKQINRHNEDGSYTYGYEAADGSFKIETKSAEGEVKGKYGYREDGGKLRVVEYGANKFGFQPAGEGITVAPPTLVDDSKQEDEREARKQANRNRPTQPQPIADYDYEDPAPTRPAPRAPPAYRAPAQPAYRAPAPAQQAYRAPAAQSAPAPPKPQFFSGAAPAPHDQGSLFDPAPRAAPSRAPKQQQQQQPGFSQFLQFKPQGQIEYTQNQDSFAAPQSRYQAQPSQYQAQPSQYQAQPSQYQAQPSQPQQQPYSMLDQLLKEFALPSNGAAPLHDITFGSY